MREICTSGSVGGEGGNILAYPAQNRMHRRIRVGNRAEAILPTRMRMSRRGCPPCGAYKGANNSSACIRRGVKPCSCR